LSAELSLTREREQGYLETINNQKRKRKRGRPFTEVLLRSLELESFRQLRRLLRMMRL
jgi:hypothetical protein